VNIEYILFLLWVFSFVVLAMFIICAVASRIFFDHLLHTQFADCRSEWERQGGPIGFFWFPREAEVSSGTHARNVLLVEWRRTPPDWMSASRRAPGIYRAWRWFTVIASWSLRAYLFVFAVCVL
jgi:hypothetical protein